MPIFRFHRELLDESLKTSVHVKYKEELYEKICKFNSLNGAWATKSVLSSEHLIIRPYIFDARIGWNTHIVLIDPGCVTRDTYVVGFLSEDFSNNE